MYRSLKGVVALHSVLLYGIHVISACGVLLLLTEQLPINMRYHLRPQAIQLLLREIQSKV
jgi:hypothetical protein